MKINEIVKMERIKKGLTLEEIGNLINKSTNAVWHYEKGTRTIDSETLEQFGKIFGYEWRNVNMSKETHKTVRELYDSLPDEVAYNSLGKYYYKWNPEKLRGTEKKLCLNINDRLELYGYRLKDEENAGEYNDIVGYMNMEIVPISYNDEIDFSQKDDILIQNPNDLSWVALCSNGIFKFKVNNTDEFKEVVKIEKAEDCFNMTTFSPLPEITQEYGYIEECFYHLAPLGVLKLNEEEQQKVFDYFEE